MTEMFLAARTKSLQARISKQCLGKCNIEGCDMPIATEKFGQVYGHSVNGNTVSTMLKAYPPSR